MSAVNRAAVEAVLRQYTDPYLNQDPVSAGCVRAIDVQGDQVSVDRKSTRLNSSHGYISYAVFCLEHTTELQSRLHLVCRLLLEKKN